MSEDEFDYEQTGSQEEDNITANDDADDELSFSEALENYLPTAENTNKVKKHFPVWFTSLITAFATCFVILMAYTFIIFPHIRPSAVISYTQNAENGDLGEAATDIGAIVQKTAPSIVKVSGKSDYRSFFGFSTQTNSGSGIIIAENGYILTANSLVGSNGEASVIIGKDTYTAKLVGQDISKDIAIIKIDLSGLAPVTLSDSDGARTGDTVIAMANILGGDIGLSVTKGIICGVNKDISLSNGNSVNLLQTDAAIGAANGGCLLDTSGNVIGMITSSVSANTDKIVFAIPSNDILTIAESIINTGLAPSGLIIGIKGIDTDHGVTVDAVSDDSPAKKSGIEKGDLILKADGSIVKSVSEINKIRDTHKKGDTIILTIYRNGEIMDIKVVL